MRLATSLLLAALLLPTAAAAPHLQFGYDAGRTSTTTDAGPEHPEVALRLELPGVITNPAPPLIIDGNIYLLLQDSVGTGVDGTPWPGNFTFEGIVRIDPHEPRVEPIVELDNIHWWNSWASDGRMLYVAANDAVQAYGLDGSGPHWSWPYPQLTKLPPVMQGACDEPAIDEGTLFLHCVQADHDPRTQYQGGEDATVFTGELVEFAVSLDLAPGVDERREWIWVKSTEDDAMPACTDLLECPDDGDQRTSIQSDSRRLAVGGSLVYVLSSARTASQGPGILYALDRSSGEVAWHVTEPATTEAVDRIAGAGPPERVEDALGTSGPTFLAPAHFAATADRLYVKWDFQFECYDGSGASVCPDLPLATEAGEGSNPLSLAPGAAFAGARSTLYRVSLDGAEVGPSWTAPFGTYFANEADPIVAGNDLLYVMTYANHGDVNIAARTVTALDATTFQPRWQHTLAPTVQDTAQDVYQGHMAVADGLLVFAHRNGVVEVLGETAASIPIDVQLSDAYPPVGAELVVDLSGTGAGAFGAADEYQVHWGDGSTSAWQSDPRFDHVYSAPGRREVVATARNEAGQSAIETFSVDVGGSPPPAPTYLEKAFARENQDLTFGILGILLAIIGGLIAILGRRRRRNILQRELEAIDAAAEAATGNPARLRAAMDERRAHCHGLLLDGRIDEAQYAVLERHIDAVGRGARMEQMRELFDFLPYAMVTALEEMLADGRVTAWERRSFRTLLDDNDVLTAAQKRKVGGLIDEWFAQDEGGAV